jgi:membrane-associated phospholipid phosphatase
MSRTAFFGVAKREDLPAILILTLAYTLIFEVLYGAASALAPFVPWRVHVDFPFEAHIPFVPEAAAIYLSLIPMLLLAPFVLRDLRSFLPLVCALTLETVIGFFGFMLLPVEPNAFDKALPATDSSLYAFADWVNLHGNWLPSLHVAFAVTAMLAYSERVRRFGKTILFVWTCAIAISTLLTHQHYLLDVVTGAGLAWMCWRFARAWAPRMRTYIRATSG